MPTVSLKGDTVENNVDLRSDIGSISSIARLDTVDTSHMMALSNPTQTQVQMEQDVDLQLSQQREQDIRKLESDIVDVNQIFKDLGMLVHEQVEVIDCIEANVESAIAQQLHMAKDYQSKARRKKCIIIIIILVILAVIGLIIGLTVNK